MSGEVCGDNRFEIIEKAKEYIIENTNISSSPEEMKVLDNILFRFWQLRLLEKFNPESKEYKWMGVTWYLYRKGSLPPLGVEVIAFNHKWINEDFNPRGIRVGFRTEDGDFISAYWWDYQDDYIAIAKWKCEASPNFYENHLDNIEPEWWTPISEFPYKNINKDEV